MFIKGLITLSLVVWLSYGHGQTESVYLHMDKTLCYPGDTVWFRGYIFDGNYLSKISTNLYVELFDNANQLINRRCFPVNTGSSVGQMEFPKKSGLYWLRAYTQNSNFFLESVTIRGLDNRVIIRRKIDEPKSFCVTEECGLLFNSKYAKEGISTTIFPTNTSKYYGKELELVCSYNNFEIARDQFVIDGHQKNIIISQDSLKNFVHGFVKLLFYNADTLITAQDILLPCRSIPIEIIKDTGGYILKINDSANWKYSLAIFKPELHDRSSNIGAALSFPGTARKGDTSYLVYNGIVKSTLGKKAVIKNEELVVMLEKDSFKTTKLLSIDSFGHFNLSGLYFFDTAHFHYMLNGYIGDRLSDIEVSFPLPISPEFAPPDASSIEYDTLIISAQIELPRLDSLKYLKPVYVVADYRKALDNRYTTGRFSWPAHFRYDLIRANKYNYAILDYLRTELPFFDFDITGRYPPGFKNRPVTIYLDEMLVNWQELFNVHINELAYVKVIEDFVDDNPFIRAVSGIGADKLPTLGDPYGSDNGPSAMICIYTRKDKDLRGVQGKLLSIPIKGYDRPKEWRMPDRSTYLWVPFINAKEYKFTLPIGNSDPFELVAEGVDAFGETFHFEKRIN